MMTTVVRNLVLFSGQVDTAGEEGGCSIHDAVLAAHTFLSVKLSESDVRFEVRGDSGLRVRGELVRVTPILITLISNAVDAVRARPVDSRWVEVRFKARERSIVVDVVDANDGITPEIADRLFLPYFTTKDPGEGTGMGLSLAIRAAHGLGGDLRLDRKSPNTDFQLTLPRS
jgi:two-component system C4-dicarboxylate transport sensor histidine kinase DctB